MTKIPFIKYPLPGCARNDIYDTVTENLNKRILSPVAIWKAFKVCSGKIVHSGNPFL